MANHLSREQILQYRDRQLIPAELVAADEHLAECEDCRGKLSSFVSSGAWAESMISAIGAARHEHLSYEQMDGWVENTLDSVERELVIAHAGVCEPCAWQLQAYEKYAPAMSAPVPPPARPLNRLRDRIRRVFLTPRLAMVATVALVVAALSPLAIRRAVSPAGSESLASLRPRSLGDLPANPDTTLAYPVSEAVEERQPILEWQAAGDGPARILVLDAARKEIARSAPISGTRWLVPVPLDRGAVYSWEVRTSVDRGATVRQASFRVLGDVDERSLAEARASHAGPLAIGDLAREMGVLSEAQRQFESLVKQNPGDSAAANRLNEVKRLRGR